MLRFLAVTALIAAALPAQQRTHKAHIHGHAKLSIAFESTAGSPAGELEFEAPAESIIGFEYEAKTPADKAKQDTALANLEARFREMVILPASCQIKREKAGLHRDGTHAEVRATFKVQCSAPIAGQRITFGFAKVFPKIDEVDVQLLAGSQQASLTVKSDKGSLTLAK